MYFLLPYYQPVALIYHYLYNLVNSKTKGNCKLFAWDSKLSPCKHSFFVPHVCFFRDFDFSFLRQGATYCCSLTNLHRRNCQSPVTCYRRESVEDRPPLRRLAIGTMPIKLKSNTNAIAFFVETCNIL